ncbi:uncharacterized protein LY89DRAFT_654880 [Mollisia scopiformis]|uniref:C3H1-type domain-containing protein n=1 Tax=Mollisia scopiformis TaxID=149040 RepID=A0A194WT69_MOLSC|nr:uncharacterized protein LY89DRAFT_654880 [Mollisia scopiformis]KUJ11153.1 hypothetical protein LY89DRAFT_654880 [Mollisia scopiformis]
MSRGSGRGSRVPQVHRNRTLVLNGNNSTTSINTPQGVNNDENAKINGQASTTGSAWVSKTDRHLQIINTSIYEKESQLRTKAIEETRQQKLRERGERDKKRFTKQLQRSANNAYSSSTSKSINGTIVDIEGIAFRVTKNGDKLIKVPSDPHPPSATPKTWSSGGILFFRSKNGNLYRAGIVTAHRRKIGLQKIQEPCRAFTTTGSCNKGPKCRYIHDPSKVAVCKKFLKGSCPSGDKCDLSHELTPERTPTCLHFAKGNCSKPNCQYPHVRVSPSALVCRAFGIYGYCEKGTSCTERHVHECPDFSNTGTCDTKGCKLLHRHKASVMRTNTAHNNQSGEDESSDISSDDGGEIGDEDVDSDDLEEFLGDEDGDVDCDIPMQQDYVQLS